MLGQHTMALMAIRCHTRTAQTFWELNAFDDYVRVSERLIEQARQSAAAECGGDESDKYCARAPFDDMQQKLRYASTVFLFSIVETECERVLTLVGSEQTSPPGAVPEKHAGESKKHRQPDVLSRLKYKLREKVDESTHRSLCGGAHFSSLQDLRIVRNCIAHANGRVENCKNQKALQRISDLNSKSDRFRPEAKRKGAWCTNEGPIHLDDCFVQLHAENARGFFQKLFEQLGWPVDECFRFTAGAESKASRIGLLACDKQARGLQTRRRGATRR